MILFHNDSMHYLSTFPLYFAVPSPCHLSRPTALAGDVGVLHPTLVCSLSGGVGQP